MTQNTEHKTSYSVFHVPVNLCSRRRHHRHHHHHHYPPSKGRVFHADPNRADILQLILQLVLHGSNMSVHSTVGITTWFERVHSLQLVLLRTCPFILQLVLLHGSNVSIHSTVGITTWFERVRSLHLQRRLMQTLYSFEHVNIYRTLARRFALLLHLVLVKMHSVLLFSRIDEKRIDLQCRQTALNPP